MFRQHDDTWGLSFPHRYVCNSEERMRPLRIVSARLQLFLVGTKRGVARTLEGLQAMQHVRDKARSSDTGGLCRRTAPQNRSIRPPMISPVSIVLWRQRGRALILWRQEMRGHPAEGTA